MFIKLDIGIIKHPSIISFKKCDKIDSYLTNIKRFGYFLKQIVINF